MNDYELARRFKEGASIDALADALPDEFIDPRAEIEARLRAIMVGMDLARPRCESAEV